MPRTAADDSPACASSALRRKRPAFSRSCWTAAAREDIGDGSRPRRHRGARPATIARSRSCAASASRARSRHRSRSTTPATTSTRWSPPCVASRPRSASARARHSTKRAAREYACKSGAGRPFRVFRRPAEPPGDACQQTAFLSKTCRLTSLCNLAARNARSTQTVIPLSPLLLRLPVVDGPHSALARSTLSPADTFGVEVNYESKEMAGARIQG